MNELAAETMDDWEETPTQRVPGFMVAPIDPHGWIGCDGEPLFSDLAAVLAGGIPQTIPEVFARTDGVGLFYRGAVNVLFGDPESGKTWVAVAAIAAELNAGGSGLFIDIDHNKPENLAARFADFGIPLETITDPTRFLYAAPDDWGTLMEVVRLACETLRPGVVVVDSLGELLPMAGANSNNPDEYSRVHRAVLTALAKSGACVVAIDHVPKNTETAARGATGTAAKRRAVDGAYLRVVPDPNHPFTPGHGGAARLFVFKDRHGGLRAHCPTGDKEPPAGRFVMTQHDHGMTYAVYRPDPGERNPETIVDELARQILDAVDDPNRLTVADVAGMFKRRRDDCRKGLELARQRYTGHSSQFRHIPTEPGTDPSTTTVPGSQQFPELGTGTTTSSTDTVPSSRPMCGNRELPAAPDDQPLF